MQKKLFATVPVLALVLVVAATIAVPTPAQAGLVMSEDSLPAKVVAVPWYRNWLAVVRGLVLSE